MNTKIIAIIVGIVIIGAGSFYGGMVYGQGKSPATAQGVQGANAFANLSPEERQARFQQFGAGTSAAGPRGARTNGGGFTAGEIAAKDDKSLTIKLPDGSSKIIFFSDSTKVTKTIDGSSADISVGMQVTIAGTANADGSTTALSVQIRPALPINQ